MGCVRDKEREKRQREKRIKEKIVNFHLERSKSVEAAQY